MRTRPPRRFGLGCPPVEHLEGRRLFSTYTVTTLGDGAGIVSTAGPDKFNATTLRAALNAANARGGADTIRFAAAVTGTINLNSALPAINDSLTIAGPGASKLAVKRAAGAATNFSILRLNAGKKAAVLDLTLAKGTGTDYADAIDHTINVGGGVFNRGALTFTNCVVSDNRTYNEFGDGGGGGIYNLGTLSAFNCTIANNVADSNASFGDGELFFGTHGGGLHNAEGASAALVHSTLSGNSTTERGGGVYNESGATLNLASCTLSANDAYSGGGLSTLGTVKLVNCTVANNTAVYSGGIGSGGSLAMTNCTVVGNKVNGEAAGVYNGGSMTLHNSIVAGNLRTDGGTSFANNIIASTNVSGSYNVVGPGGSGGLVNNVNGNKVGVTMATLKLGSLASNGGKTKTMALLSGSPAINAGSNARAADAKLLADQRGLPRVANGRVDVGAFEVQKTGGSIAGTFFNDLNHSGSRQNGEPGLPDMQLYIDANKNSTYDAGEMTTFTSSTGAYKFTGLTAGTYRVRGVQPPGWVRTRPSGAYPAGFYDVTINLSVNGGAVVGKDFGSYLP